MSIKWPYLAGLLDGEGSICMYVTNADAKQPNHCSLQVVIYNTSLKLMKWLVAEVGGRFYVRTQQASSKRIQYVWHPSGSKNREKFLLGVLPYLVIKEEQAKLALEFLRIGDQVKSLDLRRTLAAKCSQLNRGEESVTTNTLDATKCNRCGHLLSNHDSTGCNERVSDAAGDMDYCFCS